MNLNIPLIIDINKSEFLKGAGLIDKEPVVIIKTIANGELPELDEYLNKFLVENKEQIKELIRYNIALEIGKDYIK